jgi:uncharacterized protein (DUF305 family)
MTTAPRTVRQLAPGLVCFGLLACATAPASQAVGQPATTAPTPVAAPVASAPVPAPLPTPVPRDTVRQGYTAADVRFMQQMIHHHAQAVRISALVPARSSRADVRALAERIDASQQAEIEMMRHWLAERHELVPGPSMPRVLHDSIMGGMHGMSGMHDTSGMHDMAGMPAAHAAASTPDAARAPDAASAHDTDTMLMPGMLTPAEMDALAAATGPAFDRLFLEGMIRHHEGALTMVAALLASPGGAEEPQIFGFASDVDSGQRAEIRRMQAILATMSNAVSPR